MPRTSEFDTKIQRYLLQANTAHQLTEAAIQEFTALCIAGNWTAAEEARVKIVANMEAYLDGMAGVYRTMQGG